MKSRITIEVDFDQNSPFILIREDKDLLNPDVRDTLIRTFREKTGYSSSWCRIVRDDVSSGAVSTMKIYPVTDDELIVEGDRMQKMGALEKCGGFDLDQVSLEDIK